MFQRIIVDDWARWLPMVSFFLFAMAFGWVTVRALRLEKSECSRLAALPMDPEPETLHHP
jgi:hypothetical protein